MTEERRRYFRIDDTIQLSYQITRRPGNTTHLDSKADTQVADQDQRIDTLVNELKGEYPKLIELITLLDQKSQRLFEHPHNQRKAPALDGRAVNISACGLAFVEDATIPISTQLLLFLMLDDDKLEIDGLVIDCQHHGGGAFIWRVDFLNLSESTQEKLIQHIVRRQRLQLARRHD